MVDRVKLVYAVIALILTTKASAKEGKRDRLY